jgi:Lon protease-like protein
MADDCELGDFNNVCRLFPLPQVVLFPHAVMPLHIFEPRYRQMTEDALADGDKLITMVQLRGEATGAGLGVPPVEPVGCLGRILQHRRLSDGRFNFLLLGLKRVRLTREIPSERLYRLAAAEVMEDQESELPDDRRRTELLSSFREVARQERKLDSDLSSLLDMALPLGMLTDLVAHALGIPAEVKQGLLAETRVVHRADSLLEILGQVLSGTRGWDEHGRPFPPPFSAN